MGHNYVGTEHILLGLLREGDGVAAQVLVRMGADLNRVRQQVIGILSGHQDKDEPKGGRAARRADKAARRQHGPLPEILGRVESINSQLSAIGSAWVPGPM